MLTGTLRRPILIAATLLLLAVVLIVMRAAKPSTPPDSGDQQGSQASAPKSTGSGAPETATKSGTVKESGPRTKTRRKLNSIIIPIIDVKDAPIEDVVSLLRTESMQRDPESDPLKKGFNYTIRHRPQIEVGPDAQAPTPRITWRAEDVSVFRALEEAARQSNMKVLVDEPVVVIYPDPDIPNAQVPTE